MNCFELYHDNLTDTATLTPSTVNILYPVSNLTDHRRSKVYRSTTASDNIVIDLGSAKDVDSFFIVGDKRTGLGINALTVEFNSSNSWGAPAASEVITLSSEFNIGQKEFTTKTYRYIRLVFTSSLAYCELSNIFIGKKLDLGRSISYDWTFQSEDLSVVKGNRYGQRFVDAILRRRVISGALRVLDVTMMNKFLALYDGTGDTKPFFIKLGNNDMIDDYLRLSGMFFFKQIPQFSNKSFGYYNLSMTLEEAT